ncbi:hypothetical protein [Levilactobacillus andaensis]|uniref:hypothetical protein n=1 Tax=Levilactobacillus andaensis TaxID=2799570 RepID=UPI001F158ADD|nr:hypothetical protein [Levilactobacillus andaensis]
MELDNIDPYSDRLQALEQLRLEIEIHMDIQIKINNTEWYIGWPKGSLLISKNNGEFEHDFKSGDSKEVLDYVVDGKKIRDQWRDIVIVAM